MLEMLTIDGLLFGRMAESLTVAMMRGPIVCSPLFDEVMLACTMWPTMDALCEGGREGSCGPQWHGLAVKLQLHNLGVNV